MKPENLYSILATGALIGIYCGAPCLIGWQKLPRRYGEQFELFTADISPLT